MRTEFIGASGDVGSHVSAKAAGRGHKITAFVRSGAAATHLTRHWHRAAAFLLQAIFTIFGRSAWDADVMVAGCYAIALDLTSTTTTLVAAGLGKKRRRPMKRDRSVCLHQ